MDLKRFIKVYLLLAITFLTVNTFSQTTTKVKGSVFNAKTHEAIEFANVSVIGSASGASTDVSGNFVLSVDLDLATKLVFSHINYKKKEVEIRSLQGKDMIVYLEPKQEKLDDVVVTASRYEQSKLQLSKSAAIIYSKEVKDKFLSNMIDALSSTPGFTQVWEYHSPIILRGLNSKRLIIMKNGNRRIGTFPGGYFAQNMNIYDIRKIEIIKGPGSVMYGSGAISGIINVISYEPFGERQTKANILSGYGANNNEFLEVASICHKNKNFGLRVNAKYRKTDDYVYGNGKTAENSNVEDRDFSLSTGFRLSTKHTFKLNADYHYGDWGKPRGFNGALKRFTKIRNTEHNQHVDISYEYAPAAFVEILHVNIYVDYGKRDYYKYKYSEVSGNLSSLELVHYNNINEGGQLYSILNLSEKSKLTVGADGYSFRLDNPADIIDYYNQTEGSIDGYSGAGQQNIGAFIQNESQITQKLKLVSGIRSDYAEVSEGKTNSISGRNESRTALSGNVGLVFSINKKNYISANVGRAFRMPTAEELFTEVISCKGLKKGNPELQPEYSWNIDLGIRGRMFGNKFNYDLALFYNMLDDFISEIQALDDEDVDFTFKNTDAIIYGSELSASYRFNHVFKPTNSLFAGLGAAYIYGIDKSENTNTLLFGIPPFKLNFDLNYRGLVNKHWLTGYFIKLNTEYAAIQNRVITIPEGSDAGPWGYEPSDPHTVFNFALGLNSNVLPGYPKLRFIVKNILDTDYQPFGSYIPAMGRNFKTTLSFTIN